jgi:ferric-dicitrate binding protein FerR (iron transport regulator)
MALEHSDRELLLSKYLDQELTPEETAVVAEKIHCDPLWRAEFERLRQSDARVASTLRRFHGQSRLARRVMQRLDKEPAPQRTITPARKIRRSVRRRVRSGGWGWLSRVAGVAIVATATFYGWRYYSNWQREGSAVAQPAAPLIAPPADQPILTANDEVEYMQLPDGTKVWVRKGTQVYSVGPRSVKIAGSAFFHVAPGATAFVVVTPDGTQTQVLGTRFEVETVKGAPDVRVAEGHVRVQAENRSVDAFGGMEVQPDLSTRTFDPRALLAEWSASIANSSKKIAAIGADGISPWSQTGGSATHSGLTPLNGPAKLINDKFAALPEDAARTIQSSAVIALGESGPRAYVVARSNSEKEYALLSLDLKTQAWKVIDKVKGATECAPVVTPRGLVVFANPEGVVKAYDASGTVVWNASATDVAALTACADEKVICSGRAGLVAINGRDGQILWKLPFFGVKAPVCTLSNGMLCAVSQDGSISLVDAQGHSTLVKKWNEGLVFAPVAADESVWVRAFDGRVAKMLLKDSAIQEKSFGHALSFGPLSNGLLGINSSIVEFSATAPVEKEAHDPVLALVQDGHGDHFVSYKNGLIHLRKDTGATREFVHITRGEVLPGGLSVGANLLLVTTTQGIQIFE